MKQVFTLLLSLLFLSTSLSGQADRLFGLYWNGNQEIFAPLDLSNNTFTDLSVLPNVETLVNLENTIDRKNGRYFTRTNLGITIVDVETGNIVINIPTTNFFTRFEYDEVTNKLFGVYRDGTEHSLAALDLTTNTLSVINTLVGVENTINFDNAFDVSNRRYFIHTNLGITIINVDTGNIISTIPNPNVLSGLEYDPATNRLLGIYWNGTAEKFAALDLSNNTFSEISTLTDVQWLINYSTTFDDFYGRYFFFSNLGITEVDAETGNILSNIPNPDNISRFEYGFADVVSPGPTLLAIHNFEMDEQEEAVINLEWEIISEQGSSYFIVEKSINEAAWIPMHRVDGKDNSTTLQNYSTIDRHPAQGTTCYRLKQIQLDGQFKYSNVQCVNRNDKNKNVAKGVKLFPNPTVKNIYVEGNSEELNKLSIFNAFGQNVTHQIRSNLQQENLIELNLAELPTGIYYLNTATTKKMFFKR
ncbi:MAG: T9SS type A sorting domain-containing protein [Saprospiraceae bacterium]